MKCRQLLEPEAVACVECGKKIEQSSNSSEVDVPVHVSDRESDKNTVSYHEDRNSLRFDASLSDTAIQGLGPIFGDLFVKRGAVKTQPLNRLETHALHSVDARRLLTPDTSQPRVIDVEHPVEEALSSQSSGDKGRLLKIFTIDGDSFELSDNRLKATTGAEYLRKLTYLFLYAHECYDRKSILESELKTLLKSAKMLDVSGNAGKWLNKRIGIASDGPDKVKLTAKGREEALATLEAALDSNLPDTWNPDTVIPQKRAPRKKKKA